MKITTSELENMTQEELFRVAQQVSELKKARIGRKIESYPETMHAGQEAFHVCSKRIRFVFAGNRGGKSTGGCVEFIWHNAGTHPFQKVKTPIKSAIVVPDFSNHAIKILEPKLIEWAGKLNGGAIIKDVDRNQAGAISRIYWTSGSVTDVYSWDQDPMVFEGTDYDLVWFDEPPPRTIWVAMWRSCTDRGGRMYLTGTPLNCDWLFTEFQKIRDSNNHSLMWYVIFDQWANAKNIGEGDEVTGRQRLEEFASLYDEEEKKARVHGMFVQMSGMIFKAWSHEKHLIPEFDIPHSWPIIESIDPHPQKPWAIVWVALAPNGSKILLSSMYAGETIDEIADAILMGRARLPIHGEMRPYIKRTLIDNSSSVPMWQRSNKDPTARRLSVREEMEMMIGPRGANGPRIEVAPKNVQGKIDLFKRWLKVMKRGQKERPDFYVFDNEDNNAFVKEIESYRWAQFKGDRVNDATGRPVKKKDDIIDAVLQIALTIGAVAETSGETTQPVNLMGEFRGYGSSNSVEARSIAITRFSG
jgi:hypothetical protein